MFGSFRRTPPQWLDHSVLTLRLQAARGVSEGPLLPLVARTVDRIRRFDLDNRPLLALPNDKVRADTLDCLGPRIPRDVCLDVQTLTLILPGKLLNLGVVLTLGTFTSGHDHLRGLANMLF